MIEIILLMGWKYMDIIDFRKEQIAEAVALARAYYEEERGRVPVLPETDICLRLEAMADNGMGVAAYENGTMVGFMCATVPFANAFGATDVKGVFSPLGANAAVAENREDIYAALYQNAARKWVRAGAVSHGICLGAHDIAAQRQFFQYGFGLRCVDAIRLMEWIVCEPCKEYSFGELSAAEYPLAYSFERMLNEHYWESPFFMNRVQEPYEEFCKTCEQGQERCFAAWYRGNMCAYLKVSETGETFITQREDYRHITGAFCLKEHRGKGVVQNLLNYVIDVLQKEGYDYLGVDFESINPTAHNFWKKYFVAYTHGVVRRIDERILGMSRK